MATTNFIKQREDMDTLFNTNITHLIYVLSSYLSTLMN